jgi:hypothetical protein
MSFFSAIKRLFFPKADIDNTRSIISGSAQSGPDVNEVLGRSGEKNTGHLNPVVAIPRDEDMDSEQGVGHEQEQ